MEKVDRIISNVIEKNKEELDMASIKPLTPDYPFSSNGLYILIGKMGSGKTYAIIRHILWSENAFPQPYYSVIVYCSTSGALDKTVDAFIDQFKSPLVNIKDTELMAWLQKHLKRKMKFYSFMKYIKSKYKKIDEVLQHSIDKHNLKKLVPIIQPPPGLTRMTPVFIENDTRYNPTPNKVIPNTRKICKYISQKMIKYNVKQYPQNLLLVLDDFAGNALIRRPDSPLCKLLTKTRHFNITAIFAVQTPKFILKNLKRMATDVKIWKGLSEEDFYALMKELTHTFNTDEMWAIYHNLKDNHSCLTLNMSNDSYSIEGN